MPLLFLLEFTSFRFINSLQNLLFHYICKVFHYIRYWRTMDLSQKSDNDITSKTIVFKADDKKHCYETIETNVTVFVSTGLQDHGSSKVKLKTIVDYKWEVKNYPGRLIVAHLDGNHIAYVIKVSKKDAKAEGMVRVVNRISGYRALIKGMSSEVLDLEFAHLKSHIILGCIEEGALHVHTIENLVDKMLCTLLIKIEDSGTGQSLINDKINWCPYVPENITDVDEYVGQQLVWIRGYSYHCYSIRAIVDNYKVGTHKSESIAVGSLKHKEMSIITGARYSPDGTTLGVSCSDGTIRFYQTYFHTNDTKPRCLHQWIPHEGKPVTSFFFLDNHTEYSADNSLWKHAITTSDNNTEIKVWCCSTWECTQVINFKSYLTSELCFRAEIDLTSSYVVLSDIKNKGLYVLQICKDNDVASNNCKQIKCTSSNSDENIHNLSDSMYRNSLKAYIKFISEFPLSSPILSFCIMDAAVRKYKCGFNDSCLLEELEDYDEENNSLYCVVIHMFIVQPKSVQECHVLYQPTLTDSIEIRSSISDNIGHDNISANSICENHLEKFHNSDVEQAVNKSTTSDISTSPKNSKIESSAIHQTLINSQPKQPAQINLITPDSFNSPGKLTPEGVSSEVLSTLRMLAKVSISPDVKRKSVESVNILNLVNNKVIEEQEQQKLRKSVETTNQILVSPMPSSTILTAVSGGSSPSREVQEILSLKDSDCLNEFYDELCDLIDECDVELITDESYNNNDNNIIPAKDGKNTSKISLTNKSDWPKVPQIPSMTNMHCSQFNNISCPTNTTFNDIGFKMDQLMEIIQTQTCQMSELRNEVMELQKNSISDSIKLDNLPRTIEFSLSKLIEEYLIRYEREHNKKLDAFMNGRDNQNRELSDSILHAVAQQCNQINERFSAIILTELQRSIFPLVATKLDGIKNQIQLEVAQKLTVSDQLIKENMAKVCTSKETIEIFANAILLGVQTGLQKTYTETLKTTLLPAYEKSSEEMFKQIQEVFLQGTKSYVKQFDAYMSQYQPLLEDISNLLQIMPEQLKSISDSTLTTYTTQINNDLNKDLKALQINLVKSIRDNIKNEIQKGFENQAANIEDSVISLVRSQVQTPAPSIFDVQEQIKLLLSQGQINTAFHQALVANDLNLVEFTLEKADFKTVFNPCPLQQTVLLSLIQQISADMNNYNELKHKYLADAILSLNLCDPTTKEHAPKILRELFQHCQSYTATIQNTVLSSGVKMLMMAIQGLGVKII